MKRFLSVLLIIYCLLPHRLQAEEVIVGGEYTRKIPSMISVYVKDGSIPNIHKVEGAYEEVEYTSLFICPNENTVVKIDYSEEPSYMSDLKREMKGYSFAAAINGSFFNMETGEANGALRSDGRWLTYQGSYKYPNKNEGFVNAYLNKCELKLSYNGLENKGTWWEYSGTPGKWTANDGPDRFKVSYDEVISGAYTLFVEGEETNLSPEGTIGGEYAHKTDTQLTLFGATKDGRFLMVKTSSCSLSLEQQRQMVKEICEAEGSEPMDVVRMDGGGSSQMVYDTRFIGLSDVMDKTGCGYDITFRDKEGEIIRVDKDLPLGSKVVAPEMENIITKEKVYRFAGWNKKLTKVFRDKTYQAVYEESDRYYFVIFKNNDKIIKTLRCTYGELPDTNGKLSLFDWAEEIVPVTENCEYHAISVNIGAYLLYKMNTFIR